jgi:purine nucleoside permease
MRALILLLALAFATPAFAQTKPIPIKVVVLTAFEVGADRGDIPGEVQLWVERYPLGEPTRVAGIEHAVYVGKDGVMGVVLGEFGRARTSMAALLGDPRFDFSKAYWLVAGIAGVDPRNGSIGSAAWSDWVVDGDPLLELDDRETPPDWPWGLYARHTPRPGLRATPDDASGMVWRLDPGLTQWAYRLTKDVVLADTPALAKARADFRSEPKSQAPPNVFVGASMGSVRFWHGERRTAWARDWVRIWTDGQAVLTMTDGEDQAVLDTLRLFAGSGRVDDRRVLVLRTASNYSREGDGQMQAIQFADGGLTASVEAAYRVGSPVVRALVAGWDRYATELPK